MYKPKLEKDIRCPLEYGLDVLKKFFDTVLEEKKG